MLLSDTTDEDERHFSRYGSGEIKGISCNVQFICEDLLPKAFNLLMDLKSVGEIVKYIPEDTSHIIGSAEAIGLSTLLILDPDVDEAEDGPVQWCPSIDKELAGSNEVLSWLLMDKIDVDELQEPLVDLTSDAVLEERDESSEEP